MHAQVIQLPLIAGRLILNPSDKDALAYVNSIPRDDEGPVFREPWEAQAFAMALALHEKGHFTWPEWAEVLSAELKAVGANQRGEDYYLYWLAALEKIVVAKNIAVDTELNSRKSAWDRAAKATPHGEPIVLGREKQSH